MKLYEIGFLADKTAKITGETAGSFVVKFNVATQKGKHY